MTLSAMCMASVSNAQTKSIEGKAEAGRTFALQACTGCHLIISLRDEPPAQ
jgi:hypothetical protein